MSDAERAAWCRFHLACFLELLELREERDADLSWLRIARGVVFEIDLDELRTKFPGRLVAVTGAA